ncbi:MAG: DUF4129 domain-containing protein [Acidimicrobiales bacterium]
MRVDLPDALHIEARTGSRRTLLWTVLVAVVVVAAAGISGTTHFADARWLPHWKVARHAPVTQTLPFSPPAHRLKVPAPSGTGGFPLGHVLLWIVVGIAVIGVAMLLWRWWSGRPARAATDRHSAAVEATREITVEPEPEPDTAVLLTGLELALQALDEQREPADAIVRAWLGLQETAEESGIVRRPSETPTEFTSRILGSVVADDSALRSLLRLYLRTRFGDHPVTSDDVAAVRVALQGLARTWPSPNSPAGAEAR